MIRDYETERILHGKAEYWRGVQVGFFYGLLFMGILAATVLLLVGYSLTH